MDFRGMLLYTLPLGFNLRPNGAMRVVRALRGGRKIVESEGRLCRCPGGDTAGRSEGRVLIER